MNACDSLFVETSSTAKNCSSAVKSKQGMERKLADASKEIELMKDKIAGLELAQDEANSLSNIVHTDNVRLEHDVVFLKEILDDAQKELHSTRGVLAGERARAFQLQVAVLRAHFQLQSKNDSIDIKNWPLTWEKKLPKII